MKILVYSPAFHPSVGGLEAVVAMLAAGLAEAGCEVAVATTTPNPGGEEPREGYRVVRRPGPLRLLALTRWSDVFISANVALKGLWPLVLVRRPWVVSHHSWYRQEDGSLSWRDRLKRRALARAAASIAVSRAMADDLDALAPPGAAPTLVIENPYRDDLFRRLPHVARERDFLFVGRLVSDKGVDFLLGALARLAREGLEPSLTIVGRGPEEEPLRRQADELGLSSQVVFAGVLGGEELVETMNRHRWLVAPSRYDEPFGIVALEALACGCTVIGSQGGGLADAIGPGGWTFPNGDVAALARLLADVAGERLPPPDPAAVAAHLADHTREAVTVRYLRALDAARADLTNRTSG